MELEFDKEIDAILRKVREPVSVRAMDAKGAHLDADAIAAFAENALPETAKNLYIVHFADCDRCRRVLSDSIQMRSEAQPTFASTAATPVAAETVIPWYQKLFGSSNLALAMGALVVVFSGVLGYIVIQNRGSGSDSTVAKVNEQRAANAPFLSTANSASSSNSSTNAMAPANTSAANTAAPMVSETESAANSPSGRPLIPGGPNVMPDKDIVTGGAGPEPAKPAGAAPPPAPADQPLTVRDDKKAEEAKEKADVDERRRETTLSKTSTDQVSRDALSPAKKSGPNARSVQNNTQQQIENNNVAGMVVPTRKAGGKTFQNRDGAWYDTAYHGQATVNVARGTEEYKKLDGGLRNIGDSVGGTVVVVWKSKAYRIQ